MKFAEELFPKGTFNKQRSDGAYINENLSSNLNIYAKKIVEDMHFALIISGNDSVGNGKTTLATHTGCYLTWKINKSHKIENTFTHKNMVFKAKDLVKRSFELPKYSVIVLDEGDDLTEHGMKETAREIKKYFRKCRQLNQILILILPSFFELPRFYALARSHCLMNVKFMGEFDRGYFDFYGPQKKKYLYLKGKKDWNYDITPSDFPGRFFGSYSFFPNCDEETELYKKHKYEDMINDGDVDDRTPKEVEKETKVRLLLRFHEKFPEIKITQWAEAFEVNRRTIHNWISSNTPDLPPVDLCERENENTYNNMTTEEGLLSEENPEGSAPTKQKEVINNEDNAQQ
tara:strand:- start:913 stop:1947 length:1035 start_codon:yes stop_codon:yes gene_type:complete